MNVRMTTVSCVLALGLAGCGANEFAGASATTTPVAPAAAGVQVIETIPATGKRIVEVSAVSCKNKFWHPAPTRENALELLKARVAERGGNAVAELVYDDGTVNLVMNCWSTVMVRGVAVKL